MCVLQRNVKNKGGSMFRQLNDNDVVDPAAAVMIESMRAYGYMPETAIADVIGNSISAGSRNV